VPEGEDKDSAKYQFHWLYTNGLFGIIFAFGLLYTSLKSRKARAWRYATGEYKYLFLLIVLVKYTFWQHMKNVKDNWIL
jgi:cell division protein FtsW (lipid II flippase)